MPLLDHFKLPLNRTHPWRSFHRAWAAAIARLLNQGVLPPEYYALPLVDREGPIEIDLAALRAGGHRSPRAVRLGRRRGRRRTRPSQSASNFPWSMVSRSRCSRTTAFRGSPPRRKPSRHGGGGPIKSPRATITIRSPTRRKVSRSASAGCRIRNTDRGGRRRGGGTARSTNRTGNQARDSSQRSIDQLKSRTSRSCAL